ncbi:MAG: thermonuclease family protein [bacterium]
MVARLILHVSRSATRRILTLLSFSLLFPAFALPAWGELVARVVDGDTIVLSSGEKVRYIGVDTPETVHPEKPVEFMGKEAAAFNKALVEGKDVRLEYDVERKDKYGRTLAYVFLDTTFVNIELIRQGYAQILTIPPNVKYADLFLTLQRNAREAGRGLWNDTAATAWRALPAVADTNTYFLTRTGEKYHRAGCRYLRSRFSSISKADVIAGGYGACSVCIGGVAASLNSSGRPAIHTRRCQAHTKKGTRCKRHAKFGRHYCAQHGG